MRDDVNQSEEHGDIQSNTAECFEGTAARGSFFARLLVNGFVHRFPHRLLDEVVVLVVFPLPIRPQAREFCKLYRIVKKTRGRSPVRYT